MGRDLQTHPIFAYLKAELHLKVQYKLNYKYRRYLRKFSLRRTKMLQGYKALNMHQWKFISALVQKLKKETDN